MDTGNFIFIDDNQIIPSPLVSIPKRYENYVDKILVNHGLILDRIHKLAEDISNEYHDQSLTILVVLKGAFKFAKDLVDALDKLGSHLSYNLEFVRVKSYENEHQNDIQVQGLEKIQIAGKHILIVEDLVDSGKSLSLLKSLLLEKNPMSLKIAVLIFKRNSNNTLILPDIIGFSIPNEWIVGYNMDYNDKFRDFKHIGILNDLGKEAFRL